MSRIGTVVAGLLALSAIAVAVYAWISLDEVTMTTMGYVALVAGGLATLGLGAGLLGLVFYSNRNGFDDRAGASPLDPDQPQGR